MNYRTTFMYIERDIKFKKKYEKSQILLSLG